MFTFPLNGSDIINLGIKEGPRVGELLNNVEDWWGKSGFTAGRSACLRQLKAILSKKMRVL